MKKEPELKYFLDRFSRVDLRRWARLARLLDTFHVRQHHFFAAERYNRRDDLLESLRQAGAVSLDLDGWVRLTDYEFSLKPLSPTGSLVVGGRFNVGDDIDKAEIKPFPALYIAEDEETAYREKFGGPSAVDDRTGMSGADLALRASSSYTCFVLQGQLDGVFDLTDKRNVEAFVEIIRKIRPPLSLIEMARRLQMKGQRSITKVDHLIDVLMMVNWREWPMQYGLPANSQVFGRLLLDAGFTGVVYRSTKGRKHCCAVFTDSLWNSDSLLEIRGRVPEGATLTRIDGKTQI